ncbi:HlyD family secretion protein [soil metagenome]
MSQAAETSLDQEPKISTAPPPAAAKRKFPAKPFFGVLAVLGIVALVYWLMHRGEQTTDDAFIEAHVMQVGPQIAGTVKNVLVSDNQEVQAGDLLVELDPNDNQAVYDSAKANVDSAEAKLAQAKAQLDSIASALDQAKSDVEQAKATAVNAQKDFERNKELRQSGVVSQRDLDNAQAAAVSDTAALESKTNRVVAAEADVSVNAAAVKSAEAQVELAKALMQTASLRLGYTKIYAPVTGRVTRKNIEVGNYVQTGAAMMAVVPHEVWVIANFKETQLHHMRPGQRAEIVVDAYPDLKLKGVVDSVQKGTGARFSLLPAENATGNYVKVVQRVPVKIKLVDLPKDMPILAPGMSVVPVVFTR